MIEYDKIETLYNRGADFKVLPDKLRLAEFALPKVWRVTEKVDGTGARVSYTPDGKVQLAGRTDRAQMLPDLLAYMTTTFTVEKLAAAFPELDAEVILFGEGYGPKIQNGGNYRNNVAVRLFDVLVGPWWLEPENVAEVADKLGVGTMPALGYIDTLPRDLHDLQSIVSASVVASLDGGKGRQAEGIVARTVPLLLTRRGDRLMWKLKVEDLEGSPIHIRMPESKRQAYWEQKKGP